jgi:magnesium chelatase family protein
MIAQTNTATVLGIEAFPITVEVDAALGLNAFNIVGLPDNTIRESRDRILSALGNIGLTMPPRKIVVNLAPAQLRKVGSGFDLPIAVALLAALGHLPLDVLREHLFSAELSLDGTLRPVRGVLPMALLARRQQWKKFVLHTENEPEAAVVPEIERVPVGTLQDVVCYLRGEAHYPASDINPHEVFTQQQRYAEDLQDVKGQEHVKRALEVAAAGNHNLLMLGPPGSGKTMLARRMVTILPPPSFEEALEITQIHSIAGLLPSNQPLIATRPFRAPHHTISQAGLAGGGSVPGPGEISLGHNGVLFLDELPEFPRNVLELLRQPLEDRRLTISRAAMSLEFPCDFMLLASMNPCPCGYYGTQATQSAQQCQCTPQQIQKYRAKISGPLLDRIDLHLQVPVVDPNELGDSRKGESSAAIRERVQIARERQLQRFEDSATRNNAGMSRRELEEHATPTPAAQKLLETAMSRMNLSARAYDRILKVSRTIADLAEAASIDTPHLAEAVQYRNLDRPLPT